MTHDYWLLNPEGFLDSPPAADRSE